MNLGQIPGYYFDTEKQKYFKIQANHAAPATAKYTKSNVRQEERETKKRKVEQRVGRKRAKETVRRVIQHSTGSTTSSTREIGNQSTSTYLTQRDTTIIDHLRPTSYKVSPLYPNAQLLDVQPNPSGSAGSIIVALSNGLRGCGVWRASWPLDKKALSEDPPYDIALFHSGLVGFHLVSEDSDTLPSIVAVAQAPLSPGIVFIGNQPSGNPDISRSTYQKLGSVVESSLWSSALSLDKRRLAISGTEDVFMLDLTTGDVAGRLKLKQESRDIAWLDHHTAAYGHHDVKLWDIRSSGVATRFGRRNMPITGIQAPNAHGVQLLVADNRHIELYDTRKGNLPLLTFSHTHQGPQLQFAIENSLDVVAAVDIDNAMQIYSLRTGRHTSTLQSPAAVNKGRLSRPRWLVDGYEAPFLQSCQGNAVVRWQWSVPEVEDG